MLQPSSKEYLLTSKQQLTINLCPKCGGRNGMHQVEDEVGKYLSCMYCGKTIESIAPDPDQSRRLVHRRSQLR